MGKHHNYIFVQFPPKVEEAGAYPAFPLPTDLKYTDNLAGSPPYILPTSSKVSIFDIMERGYAYNKEEGSLPLMIIPDQPAGMPSQRIIVVWPVYILTYLHMSIDTDGVSLLTVS